MRNFLISITLLLLPITLLAQELNCNLIVNADQTGNQNEQVFKTLERQLNEFINNTKWTKKTFSPQERIDCSMIITINNYTNDRFEASLQIQASRPVYNSVYSTPIYNYNDPDFTFQYLEFQNLIYNKDQFESNLISVLAFHVYIILGIDGDSFALKGGETYFKQAQNIASFSQQANSKGWGINDGQQTRFILIDNILSPTFEGYRVAMYDYHLKGLDIMSDDLKNAKNAIVTTLTELENMHRKRPNSFLMRIFFDTKAEEIQDIFSDGPKVNIANLINVLNKIAPVHGTKWRNITY